MNITTRFLIPVILVAVIYGGSLLLGGMPSKCNLPERSLGELPQTLNSPDGPWIGEPVPTDQELFAHTGAEEIVDQKFQRSAGEVVLLHSAVYLSTDLGLPHQPKECYHGAGHQFVTEEDLEIDVPSEPSVFVRLLTFDREGRQAYVLYWYQIGHHVVLDRDDVKSTARILGVSKHGRHA